jgi:hypothetical protein
MATEPKNVRISSPSPLSVLIVPRWVARRRPNRSCLMSGARCDRSVAVERRGCERRAGAEQLAEPGNEHSDRHADLEADVGHHSTLSGVVEGREEVAVERQRGRVEKVGGNFSPGPESVAFLRTEARIC